MSRLFSFVALALVIALGGSADAGRHAHHATKSHVHVAKQAKASGARHHKKNKHSAHKASKPRHHRKHA